MSLSAQGAQGAGRSLEEELIASDIHAYLKQHERKEILQASSPAAAWTTAKARLIGRLLHDSELIYEDQLDAIRAGQQDRRHPARRRRPWRCWSTVCRRSASKASPSMSPTAISPLTKRKFIIADTPGHEQYTRNMATGASTLRRRGDPHRCPANGVLPQTRRHTFIARLLGIRHLVAAVNKMDDGGLCRERVFEDIRDAYTDVRFASSAVDETALHPAVRAARRQRGPNSPPNMPWYQGATLMHLLETIHDRRRPGCRTTSGSASTARQPTRPGVPGLQRFSIAGGVVRSGDDAVTVLPSGQSLQAWSGIVTMDGDLDEAFAPMAVTLTLADDVDVSRGDVLAAPGGLPYIADRLDAMVVWMADDALVPGRPYIVKHGTRQVVGQASALRYRVDVNTLQHEAASRLKLNEIGRVEVVLTESIAFDAYGANRDLGSLIFIDRVSNVTVGAGMAFAPGGSIAQAAWDRTPHGELHAAVSRVAPDERAARLGQRPVTVLLTGLAKVGKTAIAHAVERKLFDAGGLATVLDGQSFRLGMSRDLGFSPEERSENIRRAAETARLMNDAGLICLTSFVAPEEAVRERARRAIGEDRFLEVYLTAPLAVLKDRDEDGLYMAAERGEAPHVPGVTEDFDEPVAPDLTLETDRLAVDACAARIIDLLREKDFIH